VGLDESQTELISIGYTQVAALTEGQVEAAICYAMNEPVQMELGGETIDKIYVADYANLVSNGLITNDKTVKDRPELAQGMVRAGLRGLAYTLEHPDEEFDISLKYVPEAASDAESEAVNRAILAKSVEFWFSDPEQLGRSDKAEWQAAQRIMQQMELIDTEEDVNSMFTNQFIVEVKP
jgi:NitT/TauT family transport system substrate-binding protein